MKQRTWRRNTMRQRWRRFTSSWWESVADGPWTHQVRRHVTMRDFPPMNIQPTATPAVMNDWTLRRGFRA